MSGRRIPLPCASACSDVSVSKWKLMNVWLDKLLTHIRIPVTSVPQLYSYGKNLDKVFSIGYYMLSGSSLYVESIDYYIKVHLADGSSVFSKISLRSMEG